MPYIGISYRSKIEFSPSPNCARFCGISFVSSIPKIPLSAFIGYTFLFYSLYCLDSFDLLYPKDRVNVATNLKEGSQDTERDVYRRKRFRIRSNSRNKTGETCSQPDENGDAIRVPDTRVQYDLVSCNQAIGKCDSEIEEEKPETSIVEATRADG